MASRPRRTARAPARFGFEDGGAEAEANHEPANEHSHHSNRSHRTASRNAEVEQPRRSNSSHHTASRMRRWNSPTALTALPVTILEKNASLPHLMWKTTCNT